MGNNVSKMTLLDMMIFLFDVDGTLTPSRGIIDPNFKIFFKEFIKNHNVYIVSGSDYSKTIEQLGVDICESVSGVYSCSGNEFRKNGALLYSHEWKAPQWLINELWTVLNSSEYNIRTGNHIEHRTGSLNFSIIGRNCTKQQRDDYVVWDLKTSERVHIAEYLKRMFSEFEFELGGEISIDIYEVGKDKSQILNQLNGDIYFFGDRTQVGGNDYKISTKLLELGNTVHSVNNYKDTQEILRRYCDDNL